MAESVVPVLPLALSVLRVQEGGSVSGLVVGPGVPVLVHWSGSRSYPCVRGYGECAGCVRNTVPQWQCFFPVHLGNGVLRLVLLGSRSLTRGGVDNADYLVGRDCVFRRPRGRRFIEIDVSFDVVVVKPFDATLPVAVLFGVVHCLPDDGPDRIERAYAARVGSNGGSGDGGPDGVASGTSVSGGAA